MVTRVTRSEMLSFKEKIKSPLWLLVDYSWVTRWLLVTIEHFQALELNKSKTTSFHCVFLKVTVEN